MNMKLFLISQNENSHFDTYDSAVVCAPDEETARRMDPDRSRDGAPYDFGIHPALSSWCSSIDHVKAQLIGDAAPGVPLGVVCASFNAG